MVTSAKAVWLVFWITRARFAMIRLWRSTVLTVVLVTASLVSSAGTGSANEPVFSGPQPGEPVLPLTIAGVYDDQAGKLMDPVEAAGDQPLLLVFVHSLTRPGMALTRGLAGYADQLGEDRVSAAIVWLDDDRAKAEAFLKRARRSLSLTVPVGISVDGGEGPGAYGLNRNVELTVLVIDEKQVVANFALVQPSVSEGPGIAAKLAKPVGAEPPSEAEFVKLAYPGDGGAARMRMRRSGARAASERQDDKNSGDSSQDPQSE